MVRPEFWDLWNLLSSDLMAWIRGVAGSAGGGGLPGLAPSDQQVFLGPIPMSITWDEIRNVFYTKVQRRELLHFYVQSKPVNEVVYGQVVFDKVSLAAKVVKDGPVKVCFTFTSSFWK